MILTKKNKKKPFACSMMPKFKIWTEGGLSMSKLYEILKKLDDGSMCFSDNEWVHRLFENNI